MSRASRPVRPGGEPKRKTPPTWLEVSLSSADRVLISKFDFMVKHEFQALYTLSDRMAADPTNTEILSEMVNHQIFFRERMEAVQEVLPALEANDNEHMRALAAPLKEILALLLTNQDSLVNVMDTYISAPAENWRPLYDAIATRFSALGPYMASINNNLAYRSFRGQREIHGGRTGTMSETTLGGDDGPDALDTITEGFTAPVE